MKSMMPRNPWVRAGFYAWSLGLEMSSVIALRTLKIAVGGVTAEAETHRVVSAKREAGLALQALAHYRRRVRANHRRLQRSEPSG